jgi:hypothetical protein
VIDGARDVGWPVDLVAEGRRIAGCEAGAVLLRNVAGGDWVRSLLPCGSRLCPRCQRSRAARKVRRWLPALQLAADEGAGLYHLTFTQVCRAVPGGIVMRHERDFVGLSGRGVVGTPVGEGESCAGAYGRLRGALRAVRRSRATRERWAAALGGYHCGVEFTLRAGKRAGKSVPRWHCHVHVLAVTRTKTRDPAHVFRALAVDWTERAVGAHLSAQHWRTIDPTSGILEVLKYPMKVHDTTVAGAAEFYGAIRGCHTHQAAGAWHSRDRRSKVEPYGRWLAAREEPAKMPRLYIGRRVDGALVWDPYSTGSPVSGWHTFRVGVRGEVFESNADTFAALVRGGAMVDDPVDEGLVEDDDEDADDGDN